MGDLFDSILKKTGEFLDKIDLPGTFRDIFPEETHSKSPAQTPPEWSKRDFNQHLHRQAQQLGHAVPLPESIDLSGLKAVIDRLAEKAKEGSDYGRIGFSNLHDGKVEMGTYCPHDKIAELCATHHADAILKVPTVLIRTQSSGNYIEKADLVQLAQYSRFQALIVAAPKVTLMAVKSGETPLLDEQLQQKIDQMSRAATQDPENSPSIALMRLNKDLCYMLGIALYRIQDTEVGAVAKRVKLART